MEKIYISWHYTTHGIAYLKHVLSAFYTKEVVIGEDFIIETKGRPNESFPIRWKLFKKLVTEQFPGYILFKPQNHKECDRVIEILKNKKS